MHLGKFPSSLPRGLFYTSFFKFLTLFSQDHSDDDDDSNDIASYFRRKKENSRRNE